VLNVRHKPKESVLSMRNIFVRKNKKDLNKNVTVRNNMISNSNARPTAKP
jgi:hypothetical protein